MAIVKCILASTITTTETPAANAGGINTNTVITHDGYNVSKTLTPSGSGLVTPPVTKEAETEVSLSVGAATVNLAALSGLNAAAVDLTGLKGRVIRFRNKEGNTGAMTFVKGASNGYTGLGSAFSIVIPPGGYFDFYDGGGGVAVASGNRTIDVTGTGSEAFQYVILGGA